MDFKNWNSLLLCDIVLVKMAILRLWSLEGVRISELSPMDIIKCEPAHPASLYRYCHPPLYTLSIMMLPAVGTEDGRVLWRFWCLTLVELGSGRVRDQGTHR